MDPCTPDKISPELWERRERVFLLLAGLFLGSMTLLNVIGITRFLQLGPLSVAVGVLPYPLTFLCTDLIGELYGKKRASWVVWVGLVLNVFVIFIIWLGDILPSVGPEALPPWQRLVLAEPVALPDGRSVEGVVEFFHLIYSCTAGAVLASMGAYLVAQFCDVHLFHFWKNLTKGKHLWLRNNMSTTVSQLVDSVMVVGITFGATYWRGEVTLETLGVLLVGNYAFKFFAALIDTLPFYLGVGFLRRYLVLDPVSTH